MDELTICGTSPSESELDELKHRAESIRNLLHSPECELRRPIVIEFAGCPKSGKSSTIGILSHFLRRVGFSVVQPAEGASLRTPPSLRDDLLAFNVWSACYALRHVLEISHEQDPPDFMVLDRGLFDVTAWVEFLDTAEERITSEDRATIEQFVALDLWRRRELGVFLLSCDPQTSLRRELHGKLIAEHGSVMNERTLTQLRDAYSAAAKRFEDVFHIWHVDTSFVGGKSPPFQAIAYKIGCAVMDLLTPLVTQELLVTDPVDTEGFVDAPDEVETIICKILNNGKPRFMARDVAEQSTRVQQVVPYALLVNSRGQYFFARRKKDHPRAELRGKYTLLVGGHAEEKDWDQSHPEAVLEQCLRRELEEELIGIEIQSIRRLGVLNDVRSRLGSRHLAILHIATIGGSPKIRRQASDQEFGREPVAWKTEEEIKSSVADLDPWSQLVAARRFGAELPELPDEPTLFTRRRRE